MQTLQNRDEVTLGQIKADANEAVSNWNGEDSGLAEDRANLGEDILEAVKNLEELLTELN